MASVSDLSKQIAYLLANASEDQLMVFKTQFLEMPQDIARHPFFSKANMAQWGFMANRYSDYIRHVIGQSGSDKRRVGSSSTFTLPDSSDADDSDTTPPPVFRGLLQFEPKLNSTPDHSVLKAKRKLVDVEPDAYGKGKAKQPKQSHSKPLVHLGYIDLTIPAAPIPYPIDSFEKLVKSFDKQKKRPAEYVDKNGQVVIDLTSP